MTSPEAATVRFDEDSMWVQLSDGQTIGVPLAWFPRLLHATPQQRDQVRVSRRGLLAGLGDQTSTNRTLVA